MPLKPIDPYFSDGLKLDWVVLAWLIANPRPQLTPELYERKYFTGYKPPSIPGVNQFKGHSPAPLVILLEVWGLAQWITQSFMEKLQKLLGVEG